MVCLCLQVTTLVSSKSPQKKKGKSKRAHVLVAALERATANFVERGQLIAAENPDIEPEMLAAVEEVQKTGEGMSGAAREFAQDPCSSVKRGNMVGERKQQYIDSFSWFVSRRVGDGGSAFSVHNCYNFMLVAQFHYHLFDFDFSHLNKFLPLCLSRVHFPMQCEIEK